MVMPNLRDRKWTLEELHRLPDDRNRYELVDGELLVTPPPSEVHQAIAAWLGARLTLYVEKFGLGVVHHPRSVVIVGGEQAEPDLMVRPAQGTFTGWESAPVPLLVIEIASSSTLRTELIVKRQLYVRMRVPEYWVVDRYSRTIIRIRNGEAQTVTARLTWSPSPAIEPFTIDLAEMWLRTIDRLV